MPRKEKEPTSTADRTANWYRKQFGQLSKGNKSPHYDPVRALLGILCPKDSTSYTCSAMFTATLFIAREWEQPRITDNENMIHTQ